MFTNLAQAFWKSRGTNSYGKNSSLILLTILMSGPDHSPKLRVALAQILMSKFKVERVTKVTMCEFLTL